MAQIKPTKGNQLMLFLNDKPIAFSTAHTFNVTANTETISTKDSGLFNSNEVNGYDWEITCDALYIDETQGINAYDTLYDMMMLGEPILAVFGKAGNYDKNGLVRGGNTASNAPTEWTKDTTYRQGYVIISNLNLNANSGENATYSTTLTGNGPITKVTA